MTATTRILSILALTALAACEREAREFNAAAPQDKAAGAATAKLQAPMRSKMDYEENAYAMSQGKRLFT